MFLVRDWENGESFGWEGGQKYFDEIQAFNQSKGNMLMKNYLLNSFGKIEYFLLPYPGSAVRRNDLNSTKGT